MELKQKDWVLVRDDDKEPWKLNIFSHKEDDDMFWCVSGWYYKCIPYEGNEHLLGKTDAPEEKHVWHAGDHVDVLSDFDDMWHPGFIVEINYTRSADGFYYRVESECFKSITSTGKVWCKADQLRKPEEKPEEEFKFGDKVELRDDDGKWNEGLIIETDHSDLPYKVALVKGGVYWCQKKDVRRA